MPIRFPAAPALAALLLSLLLAACSAGEEGAGAPPPPAVTVATPLVQEVVDWDDFVGRFEAVQNVEVRPRASGYLTASHFRDGDFVRAGQLLFSIDSRPAEAALAAARAQLARAQAALVNARTELARSRTLAASQAASVEEVESRTAAVRVAEADIAAANAAIRTQQLAVGFTRVTAPISGRVSERKVDPGNSVTADQTVLTTIVSTDPLHLAFEGSEALLLKYQRQGAGARMGTPVRIRLGDEGSFSHAGTLDFVDTVVSSGSGTVRARAVVPNPTGILRPGMIGYLRLSASQPYRALLVPDSAIATDAARRILYVVDAQNNVRARPVELGPLFGNLRVVRRGIGPRDRIIINGIQRAQPGQKVQPRAGRIAAPTGPEPSAPAPPETPSSVALPTGAR